MAELWLAAGDETGGWDIVDGRFDSGFAGLAWVLGPVDVWSRALQMPLGGATALEAFSRPIAARLPPGLLPRTSAKYHVMDAWEYARGRRLEGGLEVAVPHEDPVLELLRGDIDWLLNRSGLGVLAVGGDLADSRAAGLGISRDGLRERARAFAALMTVALPFIPGDAGLRLMAEGRTEACIADAMRHNRFAESATGQSRYQEPYRDFIAFLTEDLARASDRCAKTVLSGEVVRDFAVGGRSSMKSVLADPRCRGWPFLRSNADAVATAMNGIADLAAALVPRPQNQSACTISLGERNAFANLWSGNFREIGNAIRGQ